MAKKDITQLFPYIHNTEINEFSNAPHNTAAIRYLEFHPEEKNNLLPKYRALLQVLIQAAESQPSSTKAIENLSLFIWNIMGSNAIELLPDVKIAIKKDYLHDISTALRMRYSGFRLTVISYGSIVWRNPMP